MKLSANIKQLLSNRSSGPMPLVRGDLEMRGDFFFTGPGQIDSTLEGTFSTNHPLEIGPAGKITGPVKAPALDIRGSIEGEITCRGGFQGLEGGRARGHGKARSLRIESGFHFEGSLHIGPALE